MNHLLIDGHYMLHRCLAQQEVRMLRLPHGLCTGGIFGFLRILRKVLSDQRAGLCTVVFDSGVSARRKRLDPAYKANRGRPKPGSTPEEQAKLDVEHQAYVEDFRASRRYLAVALPALGCRVLTLSETEGDDLLGWLANTLPRGQQGIIVSDDRDLFQLVSERVWLLRPMAEQLVKLTNFQECSGVRRELWLLHKCLNGDPGDGISGIKGVGEKTIQQVLEEVFRNGVPTTDFETQLTQVLVYCKAAKAARYQKLGEGEQRLLLNRELIDLSRERPSSDDLVSIEVLRKRPTRFSSQDCLQLFQKLSMSTILGDFQRWTTPFVTLT